MKPHQKRHDSFALEECVQLEELLACMKRFVEQGTVLFLVLALPLLVLRAYISLASQRAPEPKKREHLNLVAEVMHGLLHVGLL